MTGPTPQAELLLQRINAIEEGLVAPPTTGPRGRSKSPRGVITFARALPAPSPTMIALAAPASVNVPTPMDVEPTNATEGMEWKRTREVLVPFVVPPAPVAPPVYRSRGGVLPRSRPTVAVTSSIVLPEQQPREIMAGRILTENVPVALSDPNLGTLLYRTKDPNVIRNPIVANVSHPKPKRGVSTLVRSIGRKLYGERRGIFPDDPYSDALAAQPVGILGTQEIPASLGPPPQIVVTAAERFLRESKPRPIKRALSTGDLPQGKKKIVERLEPFVPTYDMPLESTIVTLHEPPTAQDLAYVPSPLVASTLASTPTASIPSYVTGSQVRTTHESLHTRRTSSFGKAARSANAPFKQPRTVSQMIGSAVDALGLGSQNRVVGSRLEARRSVAQIRSKQMVKKPVAEKPASVVAQPPAVVSQPPAVVNQTPAVVPQWKSGAISDEEALTWIDEMYNALKNKFAGKSQTEETAGAKPVL
jgi:hypothetical protein